MAHMHHLMLHNNNDVLMFHHMNIAPGELFLLRLSPTLDSPFI